MKKTLGIVFSAFIAISAFATSANAAPALNLQSQNTDVVQVRGGRNAAAALGVLGGIAVGAAIANSGDRRGYDCDAWGNCYSHRSHYREGRRGLVWNDEKDCWVRRSNYWGRCYGY